ncbi:hypothetical protein LRP50_04485 [Enterovibrio sp. ZSDZ42]|uniref:Oligosaccharide repeat unit polymerase n=1 Tax=Enterovibrio gelatinilyticus TaxID=2899819 RepID=A0ABT5QWI6_9GAMM|nr:hypothetical protein [Enterovibrio sp. ZSDZ42]MDD1792382.1 hypothetical protein [Enterovibrio sp. ZSDZ42]
MKLKNVVPLLLVEIYLLFTVYLAVDGPVNWNFGNETELLIFIFLYHCAFIAGYIWNLKREKVRPIDSHARVDYSLLAGKYYWLIVFFALIGSVIFFKNITMSDSLIPTGFVESIRLGIWDPAQSRNLYAEKLLSGEYKGNKYLTALTIFFGIFKYCLLPIIIFRWTSLSFKERTAGILVALIPLLAGTAMSLSSINFSYFFTISVCLFVIFMSDEKEDGGLKGLMKRKGVILSLVFMFAFSFWQFYAVKSGANLYAVVVKEETPANFDYLAANNVTFEREVGEYKGVAYDFYEKIAVYISQGYKGMSISLDEPFDSTYGVGHSVFLQRVFEDYLGFDVRERTYQRKITDRWDENVYWHSAYSYFANDVSFYGVTFVMLALGFYFSKVVNAALFKGNFVAKLLLPLFALMFLYLPANNQVFGFLENMMSFWVLTLMLLLFSGRYAARICNKFVLG